MASNSILKSSLQILAGLFQVLLALTFFYLGDQDHEMTKKLLSEGQITEATVIAHVISTNSRRGRQSSRRSRSIAPVFQFFDANGESQTVVQHYYSKPVSYEIGESVRLRYLPGHPGLGRVDTFWQLHLNVLLWGCGGLLLLTGAFLSVCDVNLLPSWLKRHIEKHNSRFYNQKLTLASRISGALLFFVVSAGFLILTYQANKEFFRLIKEGEQTKAVVMGFDVQPHGQYNKYAPIFGFHDEAGRQRLITQGYHSTVATYALNEQVDFLYHPAEEGGHAYTFTSVFGMSLLGLTLGLVFLLSALSMLFGSGGGWSYGQ